MMLAENKWSEKVGVEARGKTPTIRSESLLLVGEHSKPVSLASRAR